jgi:hypothetical protein
MVGYPRGFPRLLWIGVAALLLSGLLLMPDALQRRLDWSLPLQLPDGWHLPVAAIHALCAWFALLLVGALLAVHVRIGWRRRLNLATGLALLIGFALLAISAIVLSYVADERVGLSASVLHMGTAVLATLLTLVHTLKGRRLHRERIHHPPGRPFKRPMT